MDNKDLSIVAALAKSVGGGGGSSTPIPTPTAQDVGKVIKVDDNGAYGLAIDEGQNTFAGLTDTTITSPTNGQVPVFDSSDNKWKNGAVPSDVIYYDVTLSSNKVILPTGVSPKSIYDLITSGKTVYLVDSDKRIWTCSIKGDATSFRNIIFTSQYIVTDIQNNNHKLFTRSVSALPTSTENYFGGTSGTSYSISIPVVPNATKSDEGKVVQVNSNGMLVLSTYPSTSFKLGDISYSNDTLTVTLNNQGGIWNRSNIEQRILADGFGKYYFTYNNNAWNRFPVVCYTNESGVFNFVIVGYDFNPNDIVPKYKKITVFLNLNNASDDKIFIEEITPST